MSILPGSSPPSGGKGDTFHFVHASGLISENAQSLGLPGSKKRLRVFEALSDLPCSDNQRNAAANPNVYRPPPARPVPTQGRFPIRAPVSPFLGSVVPPPPVELAQRPGEPVCPFYQRTGQCRYGVACKFHHPPFVNLGIFHPVRPGQPICVYYARTGGCMYGADCKFHHPPEYAVARNVDGTPIRPGQEPCAQYMYYRKCGQGWFCKHHHPTNPYGP